MGDEGSARLATEHLVKLGHRRIGFIAGAKEYSLSEWRVQGWQKSMADAGLDVTDLLAQGDFSYESGARAAAQLLDLVQPPTAIIASNDQMALAVLDVAKERNIDVPNALSLISFDNSPVVRFATPQLTAVDQPIAATFAKAVELLITGDHDAAHDAPVIVAGELIERSSTAPPSGHVAN
jgi:LacI family transcriptional regulator